MNVNGSFTINNRVRVSSTEVLRASCPGDEESERFVSALRENVNSAKTFPLGIEFSAEEESHPWFLLVLCLFHQRARNWYTQSGKKSSVEEQLRKLLTASFGEEIPENLADFVVGFIPVYEEYHNCQHQVGGNWVTDDMICISSEPTEAEMSQCWWMLGTSVHCGVPILEAIQITGSTLTHPWLLMIFSVMHEQVREGSTLSGGTIEGIRSFVERRVRSNFEQLQELEAQQDSTGESNKADTPPPKEETPQEIELLPADSEESDEEAEATRDAGFFVTRISRSSRGRKKPQASTGRHPLKRSGTSNNPEIGFAADQIYHWVIPNFLGFLSVDLNLIDVGEETGELDTCLQKLSRRYSKNLPDGMFGLKPWNAEINEFLSSLATLQNAGLPILRSLKILGAQSSLSELANEIAVICEHIESGSTLSEAVEFVGGQIAHPMILALLRAGEASGALEVVLSSISE